MTVDQIRTRVAAIRKLAESGDTHLAHLGEDMLWKEALEAIATNCVGDDPSVIAFEALRTTALGFERRCG